MKSFLKSFFFYTAVPSLMLALTIGVYYYTHLVISALMPALGVFVSFLAVREQDDTNRNSIKTTLVAATFFLIGYWFLYQLHLPMSPWGITGWVICVCVVLTIFLIAAIRKSFDLDRKFWNVFLELCFTIGCISQAYLFWGTYFVWIPLGTFVVYQFVLISLERHWKENIQPIELFATTFGIGAISMLTQFWYVDLFGSPLWKVSIGICVLAVIITSYFLLKKYNKKKALKRKLEEQRIFAEKQDLEQKRLQREQQAEYEKERNRELDDLTKKLLDEETVSVANVYELAKAGRKVPFEVIAKVDFRQLFQVSEVKKQMTWKSTELDEIFRQAWIFFHSCFDDVLLKKTIENFLRLKDLSGYAGYEALRRSLLRIPEISQYVKLPEVSEKEQEQLTN